MKEPMQRHEGACSRHSNEHGSTHDGIRISRHEAAMLGALSGTLRIAGFEAAETMLAAKLRELAQRVGEAGGIVGHIKFVLTAHGQSSQISVTDGTESIRRFEAGFCRVEGMAIVFALEEEQLRALLLDTLGLMLTPMES